MFWETGKNVKLQPNHKFNFIARLTGFQKDTYNTKVFLNDYKYFDLAIKKIDLPKISFEFERSYAGEFVHYFQQGSIHWDPINITFIDALPLDNANSSISNVRVSFMRDYISQLLYSGASMLNPDTDFYNFETNRTNLIDLPIFCNQMQIINFTNYANEDYPTGKQLLNIHEGNATNIASGLAQQEDLGVESTLVKKNTLVQDGFYIYNPRITKIDFGSLDYSSDDINEIMITVIPERCAIYQTDNGAGSTSPALGGSVFGVG